MGKKKAAAAAGAPPAPAIARPPSDKSQGKSRQNAKPNKTKQNSQQPMDPRFAAMQTDPRFERFPDKRRTIKIDPRFAGAFNDPDFQTQSRVDKRGRKVKSSKTNDDMRKYYRLQKEDGDTPAELDTKPVAVQGRKAAELSSAEAHDVGSESESESEDEATKRWARLRGLDKGAGSSSEESDTDSDSTEEVGSEQDSEDERAAEVAAQWGIGAMAANPNEPVAQGDETHRLAAVDLDWEHVRAVDIFAALRSFLPSGGALKSVTVYPSDYGLQRMKEDARAGPQGIFKPVVEGQQQQQQQQPGRRSAKAQRRDDDSDDDQSYEAGSRGSDVEDSEDGGSGSEPKADDADNPSDSDDAVEDAAAAVADWDGDDSDDNDEVDQIQLRMYERSKLRYYYAVIECDSVASAARVYTECDGLEFELSACKFDLRFVPDEQSFEGREVRDRAESVPDDYEAPTFQTQALQHTRVKSTWDADDATRKRALGKRVTKEELRDDDFKAYLATDSDGSEPDEAQQARVRALLGADAGGGGSVHTSRTGGKMWGAGSENDSSDDQSEGRAGARAPKGDRGMEMQVTFGSGLESLAKRTTTKKQEHDARKADTVWEKYEQRRREKRAAANAKGRKNASSDEEYISEPEGPSGSEDEADGAKDPFFQHEDDPFNDPFFQDDATAQQALPAKKAAKTKQDRAAAAAEKAAAREVEAEEAKRRAELELLLMDEDSLRLAPPQPSGEGGKPKVKLSKKERLRQKRASKLRERQAGSDDDDLGVQDGGFQANLADPRFSALFTSDKFALDPTDPQFKASRVTAEIQMRRAAQRLKPGARSAGGGKDKAGRSSAAKPLPSAHDGGAEPSESKAVPLDAMVAALKRKAVSGQHSQGARQHGKPTKYKRPRE